MKARLWARESLLELQDQICLYSCLHGKGSIPSHRSIVALDFHAILASNFWIALIGPRSFKFPVLSNPKVSWNSLHVCTEIATEGGVGISTSCHPAHEQVKGLLATTTTTTTTTTTRRRRRRRRRRELRIREMKSNNHLKSQLLVYGPALLTGPIVRKFVSKSSEYANHHKSLFFVHTHTHLHCISKRKRQ